MMILMMALDNLTVTNKEKLIKIYQRHKRDIYITAQELLKDHHEAEDIVQTVIMKLSNHLEKLDDIESKKTASYIIIVTRNCCFDVLRKKKGILIISPEVLIQTFPDLFSNYDNYFKHLSNRFEISLALDQTDPNYADIITMRYFHGFSNKEISEILSITENNVSVRLNRALTSLKKIMSKEGGANGYE